MPKLRALVVVSISGALLMGCGAAPVRGHDRAAAESAAVPLPEPTRATRDCDPAQVAEVPTQITYDCYWVTVPEHHHASDNNAGFNGNTLRLAVTVLHSPAPNPSPIPVVYIAGGPGGPGGSPNRWSKYPYINDRDVIVYDQRGTGASDPDMECPEVEQGVVDMFTTTDPFAVEVAALDKTMVACHARLESSGVDVSAFSSPEMAAVALEMRIRSDPLAARSRYWLARALLARDTPQDVERARTELAASLEATERLGMAELTASARDLLCDA